MEFAKPEPAPQAPPATSLQAQYTEAASKLGVPGDIAEAWAQAMLGGDEDKLQRTVAQLGDARRAASYLNSVTDWRREQLVAEAAKQCGGEEQAGDWMRAVLNGDPAVASRAELELFAKELPATIPKLTT